MVAIITTQNNYENSFSNFAIGTTGVLAGWYAEPYMKKGLTLPLRKKISSNIKSFNGSGYKSYVDKAVAQNIKDKNFKVIDLNESNAAEIKKQFIKGKEPKGFAKFLLKLMRIPVGNADNTFNRTLKGQNAFFSPKDNAVVCNFSKFGAPVFHEITHKANSESKNILLKSLSKIRNPLAYYGTTAVSLCALLTNPKQKNNLNEKRSLREKIKDNCGTLATACMLPLTAEECIANIKGTQIAKNVGVTGELLKKVKTCHKVSLISYCMNAVITGLSVFLASKLRDVICAQRK